MSLIALLATVLLGVYCGNFVLAYEVLRLAVEGELWPQSARAVSIQNVYDTLYAVSEILLVTNKLFGNPASDINEDGSLHPKEPSMNL
ncbi:hypothetical protein B0H11DRAFT_2253746 [Mycena galericulata]|nr:hypothetical protein B0H11DRAFT_2253746 [Mycena galericulata]